MKVIFLDCDGVINYTSWYYSDEYKNNEYVDPDIDPNVIQRLNKICDLTGTKIVISSSWKIDDWYDRRLGFAGLKNIIGKTPDFIFRDPYSRGMEIDAYLKSNNVSNYVIIDDCLDFTDEQMSHVIKTDPYYGFTEDWVKVAINMLNK